MVEHKPETVKICILMLKQLETDKDIENNNPGTPNLEMNEIRRSAAKSGPRRSRHSHRNRETDPGDNSACESEQQEEHFSSTRNTAAPRTRRLKSSSTDVSSVKSDEDEEDRRSDAGYVESPVSPSNPGLSPMSAFNEERMRRRLQFFFMNPIEKWHAKRRFPYKFVVQVVKIVLVTMQLCLFAHSRYNHINYTWDNRVTFSHLFLKGWDAGREVDSYPPSNGPLAIYEKTEFFDTIDYAVVGYANVSRSIGPYDYPTRDNSMAPLNLCLFTYKEGIIYGFNESYVFNPEIEKNCYPLPKEAISNGSQQYLRDQYNVEVSFQALVKASLEFSVKTVNFKAYGPLTAPDCYKFNIIIAFDNSDHDGQTLLSLDADAIRLHCKGDEEYLSDSVIDTALRTLLNVSVITICLLSFTLCARAIYRAQILKDHTIHFFRMHFGKELSFQGRMEFLNMWYIMILFNDILLIMGSALKEQIERKLLVIDGWNICSVFLGVGNLLVWFGVLRYLGFFKTYNVVILTLKKAFPKILRFLLCALLIYAGFVFCGWLVLGPYHAKFRSLATTSECLFSLINGDDMFATFATLSTKSEMLWYFCQIYLYVFIALYIYVVLSLFISVIMDAYDTIKHYYKEGFPVSDLKEFAGIPSEEDMSSGIFINEMEDFDNTTLTEVLSKLCCCCCRTADNSSVENGYSSLNSTVK